QPAAEEHRRRATAGEECLAAGDQQLAGGCPPAGPLGEPPEPVAADQVADVVAEDRSAAATATTSGKESRPRPASAAATISAVSPGTSAPADSAPTSTNSSG